jgi:hypothetical protein
MKLRAALLGLTAALVGIVGVHLPFPAYSRLVLALFLALTACVYPGALLAQTAKPTTALAELAVAGVVYGCALLGMTHSAVWLAVGYGLHGLWDWLHDVRVVPTTVAGWFPPLCATFDFAVAVFALVVTWPAT